MAMRMQEYAVHADYAHVREYADAEENLIYIIHVSDQNHNILVKKEEIFLLFDAAG